MCISGCRMESNQNANEQVEHVEMHEDQNGACGISAANYSANGKISGILFPNRTFSPGHNIASRTSNPEFPISSIIFNKLSSTKNNS